MATSLAAAASLRLTAAVLRPVLGRMMPWVMQRRLMAWSLSASVRRSPEMTKVRVWPLKVPSASMSAMAIWMAE